jgi:hypothetical protein
MVASWKNKLMNSTSLFVAVLIVFVLYVGKVEWVKGPIDTLLHKLWPVHVDGFSSVDGEHGQTSEFHPVAAEEYSQEGQLAVSGKRTPATCYPQQTLRPEDLLPEDESKAIQEFNAAKPIAEGIMAGNLLDAGQHVGVNTVGQSLRNANRQLRSEPPNPQVNVSPWQNSTIGPDLIRRPLEVSESCGNQA